MLAVKIQLERNKCKNLGHTQTKPHRTSCRRVNQASFKPLARDLLTVVESRQQRGPRERPTKEPTALAFSRGPFSFGLEGA